MSDIQGFPPPPPPPPPPLPPGTPPPPFSSGGRVAPPWEQPGAVVQRFVDTLKAVLMQPGPFFRTMRRDGGIAPPLIYAIIGIVIGSVISALFSTMMPFGPFGMADGGGFLFALIMLPIILTVAVLVSSGILHVLLLLVAGTRQTFETTLRLVAYTMGSTSPLNAIPVIGGMIAAVWALIVLILGAAEAHEVPQGRAAVAVLLPSVICCLLGVLFAGAIMALIFGAAAAGMRG